VTKLGAAASRPVTNWPTTDREPRAGSVSPRCGLKACALLTLGVMSAAPAIRDLSKYRSFRLGTDLATVAKQAGMSPTRASVVHRLPALIQELDWRPQPLGSSPKTESAQEVVFSFYDGELFRVAINYDRYQTEGLTADDVIDAISATYGIAEKPPAPANAVEGGSGGLEEIVARWQDSQYCFDLIRSSYGPTFRLIGALKRLQAPALAAITEAKRLEDREAPLKEAARIAAEKEAERAKLEKSRLENKPKFRP
jgi:hypothetical protein